MLLLSNMCAKYRLCKYGKSIAKCICEACVFNLRNGIYIYIFSPTSLLHAIFKVFVFPILLPSTHFMCRRQTYDFMFSFPFFFLRRNRKLFICLNIYIVRYANTYRASNTERRSSIKTSLLLIVSFRLKKVLFFSALRRSTCNDRNRFIYGYMVYQKDFHVNAEQVQFKSKLLCMGM